MPSVVCRSEAVYNISEIKKGKRKPINSTTSSSYQKPTVGNHRHDCTDVSRAIDSQLIVAGAGTSAVRPSSFKEIA
jgi:hypothetical protein